MTKKGKAKPKVKRRDILAEWFMQDIDNPHLAEEFLQEPDQEEADPDE